MTVSGISNVQLHAGEVSMQIEGVYLQDIKSSVLQILTLSSIFAVCQVENISRSLYVDAVENRNNKT